MYLLVGKSYMIIPIGNSLKNEAVHNYEIFFDPSRYLPLIVGKITLEQYSRMFLKCAILRTFDMFLLYESCTNVLSFFMLDASQQAAFHIRESNLLAKLVSSYSAVIFLSFNRFLLTDSNYISI